MSSCSQTKTSSKKIVLRPQKGKQEQFLACKADICLYGGAAGGGKTFGLLLSAIRHVKVRRFTCAIFRRVHSHIVLPGGLWDASNEIFPHFNGLSHVTTRRWQFFERPVSNAGRPAIDNTPLGCIDFKSMKDEKDKLNFQGSEICLLCFDELTHFTETQFWYMFSRARSTCGIVPYIRATCNPQSEGFVRDLVDWWIDEDGFPIEERSGVIRYMIRVNGEIKFFDTLEEVPEQRRAMARTFTFINSSVYDNQVLMDKDPNYIANLESLPAYDRAQLLQGNWNVRIEAGMYFRAHWFMVIDELPAPLYYMSSCRYWDRAATTPKDGIDPDYTVGLKMARYRDNYYVLDMVRIRETPMQVLEAIKRTASQDGVGCQIGLEQEAGASGIADCEYIRFNLMGYNVKVCKAEKSKEWRAKPVSAASEQGRVYVMRAAWNKEFFSELQAFPLGAHDDQVDAFSGAFNVLNDNADMSVFSTILANGGI